MSRPGPQRSNTPRTNKAHANKAHEKNAHANHAPRERSAARSSAPRPSMLPVPEDGIARVRLHAGKERAMQRRHPWLYANAIDSVFGEPASGATVRVESGDGQFLAWGAWSPQSTIRVRLWSFDEHERIDEDFIRRRIVAAAARRAPLVARSNALRLVFGEADQLPGLVVDRYDDVLVFQLLSAGVEHWRDAIVDALKSLAPCRAIHERSDAAIRGREGLEIREGLVFASGPAPGRETQPLPATAAQATQAATATSADDDDERSLLVDIVEDGVPYTVDVTNGHKTGFYIDQRDSRAIVASKAQGRRVLNCFCYTGGFSWAALAGGAAEVVSVDSSAEALALAQRHPAASAIPGAGRMQWIQANVFDDLRERLDRGERFDLIVLDPPKFAPSAQHVDRAARAYKEINLKALKLLAPGGLLATFSCSGAISVDLFQKIVAGAVADARVDAQLIRRLSAGEDHPVSMAHPEGEYLKGLLLVRT